MSSTSDSSQLILIRHGEVASRYRGVCYGQADIELSQHGFNQSRELAASLSAKPVTCIMHSGLQRARIPAELLADRIGREPIVCPSLSERHYGHWELQAWDTIHESCGDDMLRVISEPRTYRPGGGETTFELRDRVLRWFSQLPSDGLIVAISHGGPIAALLGTLREQPVTAWFELIPPYGGQVAISLPPIRNRPEPPRSAFLDEPDQRRVLGIGEAKM